MESRTLVVLELNEHSYLKFQRNVFFCFFSCSFGEERRDKHIVLKVVDSTISDYEFNSLPSLAWLRWAINTRLLRKQLKIGVINGAYQTYPIIMLIYNSPTDDVPYVRCAAQRVAVAETYYHSVVE